MFSGDANVIDAILQVMCFSRDPKLWNVHMLDLERYKSLCEEPLPLNGSGETPLEVAKLAGFYEEISIVYKYFELPLEPSMKRKYNPEPMPLDLECQNNLTNNPSKKRKDN